MSRPHGRRGAIVALALSCVFAVGITTSAQADLDRNYCYNWHSAGYFCRGGLGVHSWDYNRARMNVQNSACQVLKTSAGNYRAGGSCATNGSYIIAHQYNGGSPYTYAYCWSPYTTAFYDCLASTP
jgi:hypothetical protein